MKNSNEVFIVLDIETLSLKENARIIEVGFVAICARTLETLGAFQMDIEKECELNIVRDRDEGTINWWHQTVSQESHRAYKAFLNEHDRKPLRVALQAISYELDRLCPNIKDRRVYAKGPEFDCVILSDAYKQAGIDVPWKFRNQESLRTIISLARYKGMDLEELKRNVPSHMALCDATYEAEQLIHYFDNLF